jgi:HAD superfamily hydrolase (TIGR01509 family)
MRLPRPVAGVVFDMDGLLIDTEALWRDVQLAEAAAIGRALPLDVVHSLIGLPRRHSSANLRAHFGDDFDLDAFLEGAAIRARKAEIAVKAGVEELLDLLDALDLPRAIATSSAREAVESHLGSTGLLTRFHAFVTREDCVQGKPHPEPYLNAARLLNLDPRDCLALEDSHNGVRSAHAAGMMTVMVPDLLPPTPEIADLCVAVAETLHDVREALASTLPSR